MARTIKLPARSNSQSFDPKEVLDVRLSLLDPDLPKGEGVVIADATDTAPKARVRNRNMVKLLADVQSCEESLIPDEFWTEEAEDGGGALPEWITAYEDAEQAEDAEETTYTFPAVVARAHTVQEGETHLPVLSVKP
jgi:hypothetical protein